MLFEEGEVGYLYSILIVTLIMHGIMIQLSDITYQGLTVLYTMSTTQLHNNKNTLAAAAFRRNVI